MAFTISVLNLEPGARKMVKKVLKGAKKAHAAGNLFETGRSDAGRPEFKLDLGGGDIAVITRAMEDGLGRCLITEIINRRRAQRGAGKVSVASVSRAARRAGGIVKRRETRKAGNHDASSSWAMARVAQCEMVLRMAGVIYGPLYKDEFCISPDRVLHYDQKHKKCQLGGGAGGKYQWYFERDAEGFVITPSDADVGGTTDARKQTSVKYANEARFCFCVAAPFVKHADGSVKQVGRTARPFNYTKQWLVGPDTFEKEMEKEEARVKALDGGRGWGKKGEGYTDRYGAAEARGECEKRVLAHHQSATRMVDWLVAAGREIFKDTCDASGKPLEDDWVLNGDGLSSWWDAGTQKYFKEKYPKEYARQVRCSPNFSNKYYRGKMVGNSPEFQPCDSNLFSDFERQILVHRALTYHYDNTDGRKFKCGTPDDLASTMTRAWSMLPPHRIVEDCNRWLGAYKTIWNADGAIVEELNPRHGRRADKKAAAPATPTEFHADAAEGLQALLDTEGKND